MPRTTFRAVTDHGTFVRKSESHNAARPFTHVVLTKYVFDDARGMKWFAQNWCGSLALAQKAADQLRRDIGIMFNGPHSSYIHEITIVPAEIVSQ